MATEVFANQPSTTVSSGGTTAPSSGTPETWTVASSASFPAASSGATPPTQFRIADPLLTSEIILVTNVSGTTWTVTRGAEGTTPVAHSPGFTVYQVVTAAVLDAFPQGTVPRSATLTVAASNATTAEKAQADYVCSGTADDVIINQALTSLTNGGTVHLSSGEFNLAAPIVFNQTAQVVQGSGIASSATGGTTINAAGVSSAFTWNGTSNLWFCSVQSLYIQSGTYGLRFIPQNTTVAAGSNGGTIANIATWGAGFGGNGVLAVASTTGFPSSGSLNVITSGTTAVISYTGVTSTSFTGCTYTSGSGTVATGGAIQLAVTFWDFYARDVFVDGTGSDGFYAYDGHGYVLDHFLAEQCGGWGVNFPTAFAQSEPEVRNGTFKFNSGGGVFMGCPGGVVAECEFTNITGTAISLSGQGSKATDNIIGVVTTGATGVGILLHAQGTIARGNVVNQCGSYGIETQVFGAVVTGNYCYSNTDSNIYATVQSAITSNYVAFGTTYGIQVNTGARTTVTGNYVHTPGLSGIYILAAAGCTVQGNIVENCQQHGILSSSDYTTIQGNTCVRSGVATGNTYDEINVSGNSAVVLGNTITGSSQSRYGVNFSGSAATGNVCAFNVITGESTAPYGASTYAVSWDPPVPSAKTGSYTLATTDTLVVFTLSGAGQTATLPSAATAGTGRFYTVTNANASTNALGIASSSGSVPAATLATAASLRVVSDGTNWQAC